MFEFDGTLFSKAVIILLGKSAACLLAHAFIVLLNSTSLLIIYYYTKVYNDFHTHNKLLLLKFNIPLNSQVLHNFLTLLHIMPCNLHIHLAIIIKFSALLVYILLMTWEQWDDSNSNSNSDSKLYSAWQDTITAERWTILT